MELRVLPGHGFAEAVVNHQGRNRSLFRAQIGVLYDFAFVQYPDFVALVSFELSGEKHARKTPVQDYISFMINNSGSADEPAEMG